MVDQEFHCAQMTVGGSPMQRGSIQVVPGVDVKSSMVRGRRKGSVKSEVEKGQESLHPWNQ